MIKCNKINNLKVLKEWKSLCPPLYIFSHNSLFILAAPTIFFKRNFFCQISHFISPNFLEMLVCLPTHDAVTRFPISNMNDGWTSTRDVKEGSTNFPKI